MSESALKYVGKLDLHTFRKLPLDVRMRLAASDFLGWRYSRDVRFPQARIGLPVSHKLVDFEGRRTDCSSLTAYLLTTVYPTNPWDLQAYKDVQIFDAARPWSPIEAVENVGIGSRIDAPLAGHWHLTQTWKGLDPLKGGHARLSFGLTADELLVLEATNAMHNIGVRWSHARWSELSGDRYAGARVAILGEG